MATTHLVKFILNIIFIRLVDSVGVFLLWFECMLADAFGWCLFDVVCAPSFEKMDWLAQ
jgi:hypothetical protein